MLAVAAVALILVVGTASIVLTLRVQRDPEAFGVTPPPPPLPTAVAARPAFAAAGARAPENVVERFVVILKRRKAMRVVLSLASVLLLLGAAAMIGYPFYTNVYQDRVQQRLDRQLASPELRDAYVERDVAVGDSLTRIKIPRLDVDTIVVEGTTASALRAGAGHYTNTPLPCEVGNVAIAGHRTTYGKPFHNLDLLESGDRIVLETPIGTCTYEVEVFPECVGARTAEGAHCIVAPTDVAVVDNTPDEARLTLTTCHPKGSARQRLVVTATMVSAESFDA